MNKTTLLELADKVEKATGPDRVLDWDIALSVAPRGHPLRADQVPGYTLTETSRRATAAALRLRAEQSDG